MCGTHLIALQAAFTKRKRQHPNYRTGMGLSKLGQLRRIEILSLLGVDQEVMMRTVSKLAPPHDFREHNVGAFSTEEERRRLKSEQFKSSHFLGGGKKEAYCSVFFLITNEQGTQELIMFRTRKKHPMGELAESMFSVIVPRLKEILFARGGYPYSEWADHISCDGYDFHFE